MWLVFILFLVMISNLPHQPVPFFSWFNVSIYFLIFLQMVHLIRYDPKNKFIHLNVGMFALLHSLSFINIFIGEGFLIPDDFLRYYFFEYKHIVLSALPALCVIHITIRYFFDELTELKVYAISLATIIPVFLWNYYPFLIDKEYILEVDNAILYKSVMLFDFLPLFFLVLYALLLYKHDWSLGEHITTLMVCFFIITIMDITNYSGNIYDFTIFPYTQYVLMVNLTLLAITSTRLLNYASSGLGRLYDSVLSAGARFGVPIKRKRTSVAILLEFARAYFHERRNLVVVSALVAIIGLNYFSNSLFLKINMAVLLSGCLILFYYGSALYQRRLADGDLLIRRKK